MQTIPLSDKITQGFRTYSMNLTRKEAYKLSRRLNLYIETDGKGLIYVMNNESSSIIQTIK